MSEQRDFVRAIIALRQEQRQAQSLELRDKNPGGFHPSQRKVVGTSDSPRAGTADRTGSVDVFSRFNNPPVPVHGSQTQFTHGRAGRSLNGPTDFAPVMSTPQEMTMDFPTLPGQDRSLDVNICSVSSESFEVPKVPTHTENNGNLHNSSDDPFFVRTSSRSASGRHGNDISAKNLDPELKLFLLKPIVKDFFDKVELSWSVQNTETQALAIRRYMANHEQEGLPSVIEMLHDLHAYEQAMVDSEMSKYPEGAVLSLRRTKTDIQHRDMVFKAVPGLQFVVQHVRRTLPRFLRLDPGYLGASGAKPPENGALAPQITEPHTATPVASSQTSSQLPSDVFGDPICAVAPGYDLTKVYNTSDVRSQTMDSS